MITVFRRFWSCIKFDSLTSFFLSISLLRCFHPVTPVALFSRMKQSTTDTCNVPNPSIWSDNSKVFILRYSTALLFGMKLFKIFPMDCCEYIPLSENLIYFIPPIQSSGEIWDENNVTKSQSLPAHDRWQSKLACKQAGFFFSRKCWQKIIIALYS